MAWAVACSRKGKRGLWSQILCSPPGCMANNWDPPEQKHVKDAQPAWPKPLCFVQPHALCWAEVLNAQPDILYLKDQGQGKSTSITFKRENRLRYLPICNCQVTHCCSALARSLRKKRAVARKNIPPRTTTNGQSMSAYPKLRNSQTGDSFVLCRIRSEI